MKAYDLGPQKGPAPTEASPAERRIRLRARIDDLPPQQRRKARALLDIEQTHLSHYDR